MDFKKIVFIFTMIVTVITVYSQEDEYYEPPEMDDIDATYFEELYYYPSGGYYLAVFKHYFYKGPSQGLLGLQSDKIIQSYIIKEITKDGITKKSDNYTIKWINSNRKKLLSLKEADFISYEYISGEGYKFHFGQIEYIPGPLLKEKFSMYDSIYIGYKNEMILISSEPCVNAS